jgi:hypothetical protein
VVLGETLWKAPWVKSWPQRWKIIGFVLVGGTIYAVTLYLSIRPNIIFESGNGRPYILSGSGLAWARVEARNRGWREAHCEFFLNALRKHGSSEPIMVGEALRLSLGGGQENTADGKAWQITLQSGTGRFVNITNAEARINQLKIITPADQFSGENPDKLGPGTYVFTISASGSNCTSEQTDITVKYDGGTQVSIIQN